MTPTIARLRALGLTPTRFAAMIEASRVTVSYWGRERRGFGVQRVPPTVRLLLDAWEAHPELIPDEPCVNRAAAKPR